MIKNYLTYINEDLRHKDIDPYDEEIWEEDKISREYKEGDKIKIKNNLDDIIDNPNYPLYKININDGMNDFLGKDATITFVFHDNKYNHHRYLLDIDNGDYWWIDECFE